VPFTDSVDREGALARAARGVLDRLADHLSGEMLSIILTDASGQVIDRRAEDRGLRAHLDLISLAPGFSYAEPVAGTNAIGLALAEERAAVVLGTEHFVEVLQPMACYAAPVRNPLTQEIEGVLDITCDRSEAKSLALALVVQAGHEIERNLYENSTGRERLLLQRFLAAVRERPARAVVAVSNDVMIANHSAATMLDSSQREQVWQSIASAPIVDVGEVVGAILDFDAVGQEVHNAAAYSGGAVAPVEHLTEREHDVLALIVAGQANKQIARQLSITEKTVKTHVSRVLGKLGVQSRTQAAMRAVSLGVGVEPRPSSLDILPGGL
jgi:transcriptional regulator of acetoin/glycerol metabolism